MNNIDINIGSVYFTLKSLDVILISLFVFFFLYGVFSFIKRILKKYTLIILTNILIALTPFVGAAQDKESTLEKLQLSTWEMQGLVGKTASYKYNINHVTHYFNKVKLGVFEYYLSDTIDQEFDATKVGKVFDGKYIIKRYISEKGDNRITPVSVFQIKQINKNWLILRNIKHKHVLKYKAID